jgi:hypothetical protein
MQKTLSKFLMEALSLQRYASVLGDVKNLVSNEPDMYQWNPKYLEKEFRESPLEKDRQAYRLFIPLGSPVKYRIIKLFDKYGLKLISYKTGKVVSPVPGATYPLNIGAVLNDLINNKGLMKKYDIILRNPEDKKEAIELLRLFAKDNDNRQKDDGTTTIGPDDEPKWIVISRHPYDIAGMSTGREWTSCQNLVSGGLCQYVPQDIAAGSIVAYLIKDSDRTETVNKGDVLRNPLSRTMIVPYINNRGETAYGISNKQYTKDNRNPIFPIIVKQWVDELNKSKRLSGSFMIHRKAYGEVRERRFTMNDGIREDDPFNLVEDGAFEIFYEDRFDDWIAPAIEMMLSTDRNNLTDFIYTLYDFLVNERSKSREEALIEMFINNHFAYSLSEGDPLVFGIFITLRKANDINVRPRFFPKISKHSKESICRILTSTNSIDNIHWFENGIETLAYHLVNDTYRKNYFYCSIYIKILNTCPEEDLHKITEDHFLHGLFDNCSEKISFTDNPRLFDLLLKHPKAMDKVFHKPWNEQNFNDLLNMDNSTGDHIKAFYIETLKWYLENDMDHILNNTKYVLWKLKDIIETPKIDINGKLTFIHEVIKTIAKFPGEMTNMKYILNEFIDELSKTYNSRSQNKFVSELIKQINYFGLNWT